MPILANSHWLKRARYKLGVRLSHTLFRLFPKRFIPSEYRSGKDINRKRDVKENEEFAVRKEDEFRSLGLVVIEFFPPSHFEKLVRNLDSMGWAFSSGDRKVSDWLRLGQTAVGGSSRATVQLVCRPNDRHRYLGIATPSKSLPLQFESASVTFMRLNPTLIVAATLFKLTPAQHPRLMQAASPEFSTIYRPMKKPGATIHSPRSLKKEAVENVRREWADAARGWIAKTLPGALTEAQRNKPSIFEVCVLENREPMVRPDAKVPVSGAEELFGLRERYNAFVDPNHPELKFLDAFRFSDQSIDNYGLLVSSGDAARAHVESGYTEPLLPMVRRYETTFVQTALFNLLGAYSRTLGKVRDRVAPGRGRRSPLSYFKALRATDRMRTDIALVLSDLPDGRTTHSFVGAVIPMQSQNEKRHSNNGNLDDLLQSRLLKLSAQISAHNKIVGEMIKERLAVSSTVEAIRLSQIAIWIAFISVTAALWTPLSEFIRNLFVAFGPN